MREEALLAIEESLTPAVVMATCQVDDVTLSEGQVIGLRRLVAVQRHHFLQVIWRGVGVVVHWWREGGHDVIKATLIVQERRGRDWDLQVVYFLDGWRWRGRGWQFTGRRREAVITRGRRGRGEEVLLHHCLETEGRGQWWNTVIGWRS